MKCLQHQRQTSQTPSETGRRETVMTERELPRERPHPKPGRGSQAWFLRPLLFLTKPSSALVMAGSWLPWAKCVSLSLITGSVVPLSYLGAGSRNPMSKGGRLARFSLQTLTSARALGPMPVQPLYTWWDCLISGATFTCRCRDPFSGNRCQNGECTFTRSTLPPS